MNEMMVIAAARYVLVLIFLFVSSDSAVADERLTVGACPLIIEVSFDGEWTNAKFNPQMVEALSSNKNRKSVVAAAYSLSSDPFSPSVFVASLGSLENHQGQIGQSQFDEIATRMMSALEEIPEEAKNYMRRLERGAVRPFSITNATVSHFERRGNSFALYSFVKAVVEGEDVTVVGAQRTTLLHGCVITMNFSFPSKAHSFRDIQNMVWDIQLR